MPVLVENATLVTIRRVGRVRIHGAEVTMHRRAGVYRHGKGRGSRVGIAIAAALATRTAQATAKATRVRFAGSSMAAVCFAAGIAIRVNARQPQRSASR